MSKIKKGLKKIAKSKLFKAVLIAATIYVGGAALGAWNAPGALGAKINGALLKGGAKAATGAAAKTTAATNTAAGITTSALPAAPLAPVVASTAAPTAGAAIANSVIPAGVGTGTGAIAGAAAPTAATTSFMMNGAVESTAKKGVISRMMEGAGNVAQAAGSFANKYPLPTAMIAQGVAGALTPDQMEIEQERQRMAIEEDDRQREIRNQNLLVGGIDLGQAPQKQPIRYASTGDPILQSGVLRRATGVM